MSNESGNSNWSQPYVKRRLLYGAALAVVAVAAGFGLISDAQATQVESWLPTVITAIGGLGASGLALANTHRGSDSTAVGDDVRRAEAAGPDLGSLVQQLAPTVRTEVEEAIGRFSGAVYGRHDAARTPADEGTGSYPDGVDAPSAYPGGEG